MINRLGIALEQAVNRAPDARPEHKPDLRPGPGECSPNRADGGMVTPGDERADPEEGESPTGSSGSANILQRPEGSALWTPLFKG